METAVLSSPQTVTAASRRAQANSRANLAALQNAQPGMADRLSSATCDIQWIFARDGYLTARTPDGWHSGCSVPLLAARQMLKKLEMTGTTGCFLKPAHAAQIRACFEIISPVQSLIAVVPDLDALQIMLHCDDFSPEIAGGRLFFAGGENWPRELSEIFEQHPGLPVPQQFLRTTLLDEEEMALLSGEAQSIISLETNRRCEVLAQTLDRAANHQANGRVVVLAGSKLRIDDLSNIALRSALGQAADEKWITLDSDHPPSASPLALAQAAADADAVVTANIFRCDLPGLIGLKTAWITWVTRGRIVKADPQYPADAVLLADPKWRQAALDAGWPAGRIQIAGWPWIVPPPKPACASGTVGLLTDTQPIEVPKRVKELSSQQLLWEMIEEELCNRPWSLGDDPLQYLEARMRRFNIGEEGFDRGAFWERLIAPAYKTGLSRFLVRSGIRLAIFGKGWNEIPEFQAVARGPVENVGDLADAVAECAVLLEPFPGHDGTVEPLPLPVVRPQRTSAHVITEEIRRMLNLKTRLNMPDLQRLDSGKILSAAAISAHCTLRGDGQ